MHSFEIPQTILDDLWDENVWAAKTPSRIFLPKTAKSVFEGARKVKEGTHNSGIDLQEAYSVKTNPNRSFMILANRNGMLAETITASEVEHAVRSGFSTDRIIVNGPAQFWPSEFRTKTRFAAVFADSIERLGHLIKQIGLADVIGVRVRPPGIQSRFGVNLEEPETFFRLANLLRESDARQYLGVHFHVSTDLIGTRRWCEVCQSVLRWAEAIEESTGRAINCIDVGGGWFPEDFVEEFTAYIPKAIEAARRMLPEIRTFILEPGKALVQPCMALVTRVLEVRHSQKNYDVVVDGSMCELPMASFFPHRMLAFGRDGSVFPLTDGVDRILGRNCMEWDVIAPSVTIPPWLENEDLIVICDAGAYDASMAYDFGKRRQSS